LNRQLADRDRPPAGTKVGARQAPERECEAIDDEGGNRDSKELSILYIDDDIASRNVMEMLLTIGMGYSDLTIFDDSANFVERLRDLSSAPDVVFVDIQLEPYDGYKILTMLRADPQCRETKVVAMTASVMADDVKHLRNAGFDGLIGKPIPGTMFPELMERILAGEPIWYVP
jgi:CheY-like chemotaxis protein